MPSEYSVFKPKSKKGIFVDYPELRKREAFKGLDNSSGLFAWYFACESSPYSRILDDRERAKKSIEESYRKGKSMILSETDREKLMAGKFSPKLNAAIDEMKTFKVGPRVRAKMLIEKGFDNISKIIDIDASDNKMFLNKDGEVDFSKKKAYVDTVAKSVELMPKMIKQLEGGFSLTDDKGDGGTTFDGENFIDNYHENQD